MSTEARDKAWAHDTANVSDDPGLLDYAHGWYNAGFDAGRASVLSGLTVERIAEALDRAMPDDVFVASFPRVALRLRDALIEQEVNRG